jgi:DNA modification methylase
METYNEIDISKLKMNPNNPRVIKDDKFQKLVKSIKEFPEMLKIRPIVVNEDMVVLGGNMRLKACKEAGLKKVPTIIASELTEEQQREFIIKDNVGYGEWEIDALLREWDKIELEEWGLDLKWPEPEREAEDDNYEIPSEVRYNIQEGDVFEIGQHKLICGDATQTDVWMRIMEEEMGDLVVTDPPYNVAYEGKTKDALTIKNDSMGDDQFYQFLYDFYSATAAFMKKGAAWYIWHADSEGANFRRAMTKAGITVKQCLIWVKNSMVMGRQDYHWKHEPCLYGWMEGEAHNWYTDRKQTTVLEFDRPQRNAEHPTMKPVELIAYQIKNSSKQGDLVLDAFGGSGTTMVACEQLGRKCRMVELDPKYCGVVVDRMKKLNPGIMVKQNGSII